MLRDETKELEALGELTGDAGIIDLAALVMTKAIEGVHAVDVMRVLDRELPEWKKLSTTAANELLYEIQLAIHLATRANLAWWALYMGRDGLKPTSDGIDVSLDNERAVRVHAAFGESVDEKDRRLFMIELAKMILEEA